MKTRTTRATKNLESLAPFLAIRTGREYDAAVARLNALVDEVRNNTRDARYRLIETLSVLIEAYDREHHRMPEASGIEVLRFLMVELGLTQKDLPEIGIQTNPLLTTTNASARIYEEFRSLAPPT
jgi:HTH-type transcriptional regulator/antitoxin HigA